MHNPNIGGIYLKEFYGSVSLSGRVSFLIEAEDAEVAEEKIFDEVEGVEIILKDGSVIEITEIEWGLIDKASRGNVQQSHVEDFEIYEEK